jgi:hypothetical protein
MVLRVVAKRDGTSKCVERLLIFFFDDNQTDGYCKECLDMLDLLNISKHNKTI